MANPRTKFSPSAGHIENGRPPLEICTVGPGRGARRLRRRAGLQASGRARCGGLPATPVVTDWIRVCEAG